MVWGLPVTLQLFRHLGKVYSTQFHQGPVFPCTLRDGETRWSVLEDQREHSAVRVWWPLWDKWVLPLEVSISVLILIDQHGAQRQTCEEQVGVVQGLSGKRLKKQLSGLWREIDEGFWCLRGEIDIAGVMLAIWAEKDSGLSTNSPRLHALTRGVIWQMSLRKTGSWWGNESPGMNPSLGLLVIFQPLSWMSSYSCNFKTININPT